MKKVFIALFILFIVTGIILVVAPNVFTLYLTGVVALAMIVSFGYLTEK